MSIDRRDYGYPDLAVDPGACHVNMIPEISVGKGRLLANAPGYQRPIGPFTFTFDGVLQQPENADEERAVKFALEQMVRGHPLSYDVAADRVFRRWLGASRAVSLDISVQIDSKIERVILQISCAPRFFDRKRLRIRLIRSAP